MQRSYEEVYASCRMISIDEMVGAALVFSVFSVSEQATVVTTEKT